MANASRGVVIFDDAARRRPPATTAAGCAAASAAPPPATATAAAGGKILQKRWVCDVCKVKWFLDFDEACAHEAACAGAGGGGTPPPPASPAASSNAAAPNVVGENSLVSSDSNDGIKACTGAKPSRAKERVGEAGKLMPVPSAAAAAARARARARVAGEKNANEVNDASTTARQQEPGKEMGEPRVADIVADSSEGEDDGNADKIANFGEEKKTEAIIDDDASSRLAPESARGEGKPEAVAGDGASSKRAPESAPGDAASGRRRSKRLRDAPRPPPLQDSSACRNASNKANGKRAQKGKSSSEKSSEKSSRHVKSDKPKQKGTGNGGGPLASIFLLNKASRAAKAAAKKAKGAPLPSGVSRKEYEEHVAAERQAAKRKKRGAAMARGEKAGKWQSTKRSKRSSARERGEEEEEEGMDEESSNDEEESDDSDDEDFADGRRGRKAKAASAKKQKNFLSKKELAEHQAADFFAKRKKAAAEERERQKKREELRLARLNEKNGPKGREKVRESGQIAFGGTASSLSVQDRSSATSAGTGAVGKKEKCIIAVRFPCPSHVVPGDDSDPDSRSETETDVASRGTSPSLQILRETPRYPHLKVDISPSASDANDVTLLPTGLIQGSDQMPSVEKDTMFDLLSSIFDKQRKGGKEKGKQSLDDDSQLWVDKYSLSHIPDDVLGAKNREASKELLEFVQEWKVRRHRSVQALGRTKRKKRRRKRSGYDSDDSFLDDGGLENIFLVAGPTGAGKTRLVRAVAEQLECAVVELNSAEPRSGAALKRAIGETTQSHSSLAVSKKRKKKRDGKSGIFGESAREAVGEEDSDAAEDGEEEDSDGSCCSDIEGVEESAKESHSLTVILIDEGKGAHV